MKLMHLAVASIVDANTGSGFAHSAGRIDYAAAQARGRAIRARSVVALLEGLGEGLHSIFAKLRQRAQKRQELNQLMALNDHLLRDIGISRSDLFAVEAGKAKLNELNASRRKKTAVAEVRQLQPKKTAISAVDYVEAKCA